MRENSSTILTRETKAPWVVQMMDTVTHHGVEYRCGISSISFALILDFLQGSTATISLLFPYCYAIHGPVRKPPRSQFNTPESSSVIITAVESSG